MTGPLAVPRILWAALFISTLLYLVVLALTEMQGEPGWQVLLLPLGFAGLTMAGASLVLPQLLLRKRSAPRAKAQPREDDKSAYLVALITAMALAEAVAIYGLILGFRGAPTTVVLPFFAVTWLLMLIRFPTQEKLDEFSK
jgi:hypothetical protein